MENSARTSVQDNEGRYHTVADPHTDPCMPPRQSKLNHGWHDHPPVLKHPSISKKKHHDLMYIVLNPRVDIKTICYPTVNNVSVKVYPRKGSTYNARKFHVFHVRFSDGTGRRSLFYSGRIKSWVHVTTGSRSVASHWKKLISVREILIVGDLQSPQPVLHSAKSTRPMCGSRSQVQRDSH